MDDVYLQYSILVVNPGLCNSYGCFGLPVSLSFSRHCLPAAPQPNPAAIGAAPTSSNLATLTGGPSQAPPAGEGAAQLGVGAQAMLAAGTMAGSAGASTAAACMHTAGSLPRPSGCTVYASQKKLCCCCAVPSTAGVIAAAPAAPAAAPISTDIAATPTSGPDAQVFYANGLTGKAII